MENSLYILIPLSLLLVLAIALILWWSVKSGQFDDLEGPAFRILMDEDTPAVPSNDAAPPALTGQDLEK
jgi:cbb3-type cytochrome oxidase maturation protein